MPTQQGKKEKKDDGDIMVYQDTTFDGTEVYVYSPEEHAEALVNKELCQKAQNVLGNVIPNV